MTKGYIQQIHPVLPVQDVVAALRFYVEKLGFTIAFADDPKAPDYAGITRDGIEIHLQRHTVEEWGHIDRPMLRFVVQHIEALYEEYEEQGVFHKRTALRKTPWGTEEFAFFDLYNNGLTFYRDL